MTNRLETRLLEALRLRLRRQDAPLPPGATILWDAFQDLSSRRTTGMGGPNPISYQEIAAWSQLMRCPLEPHHVRILVAMDRVWMDRVYTRQSLPEGTKVLPQTSDHAITPALFDLTTR